MRLLICIMLLSIAAAAQQRVEPLPDITEIQEAKLFVMEELDGWVLVGRARPEVNDILWYFRHKDAIKTGDKVESWVLFQNADLRTMSKDYIIFNCKSRRYFREQVIEYKEDGETVLRSKTLPETWLPALPSSVISSVMDAVCDTNK